MVVIFWITWTFISVRGWVEHNTVTPRICLLCLRAASAFVCLSRCLIQPSRGRHKPVRCGAAVFLSRCFFLSPLRFSCCCLSVQSVFRGVQYKLLIFLNSFKRRGRRADGEPTGSAGAGLSGAVHERLLRLQTYWGTRACTCASACVCVTKGSKMP